MVLCDPAPNNNFLFGFGFILSSPHFPQQCCDQKKHSFPPILLQIQLFVWGGREEVTSFSNITGKVPTLLTFILVIPVLQIIPFIPSILVAPFFPFILLFFYCIARFIRLNTKQCWLAVFTTNHMWGGLGV